MEFLDIDGQRVNVGMIEKIDFQPCLPEDGGSHGAGSSDKLPDEIRCAHIHVCGRAEPIELTDPRKINALRTLWVGRTVRRL